MYVYIYVYMYINMYRYKYMYLLSVNVWIHPPSIEALGNRLPNRDQMTPEEIKHTLAVAQQVFLIFHFQRCRVSWERNRTPSRERRMCFRFVVLVCVCVFFSLFCLWGMWWWMVCAWLCVGVCACQTCPTPRQIHFCVMSLIFYGMSHIWYVTLCDIT